MAIRFVWHRRRLHHDQQTAHALESAAAYSSYPTMAGAYPVDSTGDKDSRHAAGHCHGKGDGLTSVHCDCALMKCLLFNSLLFIYIFCCSLLFLLATTTKRSGGSSAGVVKGSVLVLDDRRPVLSHATPPGVRGNSR